MSNKQLRVLVIIMAALAIGSILFAACSRPGTITGGTASGGGGTPSSGGSSGGCPDGTVHMVATNFATSCVNVSKGSVLKLVDDGPYVHILDNGSWVNGSPQPKTEPGAPTVTNLQFNGNSSQIGPFNTAGTFHIYCTIHPNMNLTINVK